MWRERIDCNDRVRIIVQDDGNVGCEDQGFDPFPEDADARTIPDDARNLDGVATQIGSDARRFFFGSFFHKPFLPLFK